MAKRARTKPAAPKPAPVSLAEEFGAAMECETQAEADAVMEAAIQRRLLPGTTRDEAKALFQEEAGYFAGYFGQDTRDKAERLYGAVHPIFGKLRPTADETLILGFLAAKLGQHAAKKVAELLYLRSQSETAR